MGLCAGPYGHRLLGIDLDTSHEFEREIARGCEGIKPGWVRVNFNYFITEAVFGVRARRGGHDREQRPGGCCPGIASTRRRACGTMRTASRSPRCRSTTSGTWEARWRSPATATGRPTGALAGYLDEAGDVLAAAPSPMSRDARVDVGEDFEQLRWFWLPEEIAARV